MSMNPSSTAPSSLRRQSIMDELRLLDQRQQAQQQLAAQAQALSRNSLPFQRNGNLLQGQAKHNVVSASQGGLGSMDVSTASAGSHDPFLGATDLSQLQAFMRLHEQQQQQSPRLNNSRSSFSNRGISHNNGFDIPSHQQLLNATGHFPVRMQEPLLKLPGAVDVVKSIRKRPLDFSWGEFGGGTGQTYGGKLGDLKLRKIVVSGCSFPLPPVGGKYKKRKLTNRQSFVSFKKLWANSSTSSTGTRREIFVRKFSQGKVQILDKSGIGNRAPARMNYF